MSICIGLVVGLVAGSKITDPNVLIASLATLVAAFAGAWFAYKLQDRAKCREEINSQVNKANDLLFALFQKLNALKLFQIDSIEPWREDPGKTIGMQPTLDYKLPEAPIRPENINFLFRTKYKQLLFDAHIEEQRFEVAEAAGIVEGVEYTDAQFKAALGDLLYKQLERATDAVIYHTDRTVESSDQLRQKLIGALKKTFPDKEIIDFALLEKPPNEQKDL